MLRIIPSSAISLNQILAENWDAFYEKCKEWIRPDISENVRKVLACRTPVLGCHLYQCTSCNKIRVIPHSCKSRFCSICGKHATDVWANSLLNELLPVPYHHIVFTLPKELRSFIAFNRKVCFQILFKASNLAIQDGGKEKGITFGCILVLHTFGSDLKFHPHIHALVTAGGFSKETTQWVETSEKFLMPAEGLMKRWKYQVIKLMKKAHRKSMFRFPEDHQQYQSSPFHFGRLLNSKTYFSLAKHLNILYDYRWHVHIGESLKDPKFSVKYIGRYTKRAVLAEYRLLSYDGTKVQFSYKDYALGGQQSIKTLPVFDFISSLIRHIPDKHFPYIRYTGLFANRVREKYKQIIEPLFSKSSQRHLSNNTKNKTESWQERVTSYLGKDTLFCEDCNLPMQFVKKVFGKWQYVETLFLQAGLELTTGYLKLKPPDIFTATSL